MYQKQEKDILEQLYSISIRIVLKEKMYAHKYHVSASKEDKKDVLNRMFFVSEEVNEYKFLKKMSSSELKCVVNKKKLSEISTMIELLVNHVNNNYYCYHEIISTVMSFLDDLKKELKEITDDFFDLELMFHKYRLSLEYQRNIRIKEHPEYDKIAEMINLREQIIKFFHTKWKLKDYILEELEELINLLIDYETHIEDVKRLEDYKLRSIIFQEFFSGYEKKIESLCLINMDFKNQI